jgi:hypothetical protein
LVEVREELQPVALEVGGLVRVDGDSEDGGKYAIGIVLVGLGLRGICSTC